MQNILSEREWEKLKGWGGRVIGQREFAILSI